MFSSRVAIVLPAFQAEHDAEHVLRTFASVLAKHPRFKVSLYPIDDGSTDGTWNVIRSTCRYLPVPSFPQRNEKNLGLDPTLKQVYQRVISSKSFDWILKTDMDRDFNPEEVADSILSELHPRLDCAIGIRWLPQDAPLQPYEKERRDRFFSRLGFDPAFPPIDPASCGTQMYRTDVLQHLLRAPSVVAYPHRWGMDYLLALLAVRLGYSVQCIPLAGGLYDPERRPAQKVHAQFDRFEEIVQLAGFPTLD